GAAAGRAPRVGPRPRATARAMSRRPSRLAACDPRSVRSASRPPCGVCSRATRAASARPASRWSSTTPSARSPTPPERLRRTAGFCHHHVAPRPAARECRRQGGAMIYEYRAYYVMPGRMPDLQRRFADITMKLFKKHGITVVGFWETVVGESNEMVYICSYDDLAHRERVWKTFMADPEWLAARKASEANGPLVERVVNKSWRPTMSSAAGYHFASSRCARARPRASLTISPRKR